ncbi:MAG: PD-(D/E)XK nuclease family transposase [Candidatus Cryptobacteroides sp.]|nr:PD-(D/E)XK nuclease family transposase [Candidatus Cryptobacteroides sp.]
MTGPSIKPATYITFLNHIMGDGNIEDVDFQNVEYLGPTKEDRKAIFDVCVRTTTGKSI